MKNKIWVLNPDYAFKNDRDRICMYSLQKRKFDSSVDWIGFVHPTQAMILSLFTDMRPASEIISALAARFSIDENVAFSLIEKYMGNSTPVYTEWQGVKVSFPKNVLIPIDDSSVEPDYKFDISDLRCDAIDLQPGRMHRAPHSVLWMLTTRCATNCKYCYADRSTPHTPLPTERILELIDDFHRLKIGFVDVIGGEILLHKDWDKIIARLVEKNMEPTYISTKVPLTKEIVERLYATGYRNVVQLSLDSMDDRTLKATIGVGDGYVERVKNAITLLQEYGYPVQIDTVLTSLNANREEIDALYDYIKSIKTLTLWEIRVPELSVYAVASFMEVKADRNQLCEIRDYVKKRIIPTSEKSITFSDDALDKKFRCEGPDNECFHGGACGVLHDKVFILPDGKVSVCEQMYWHKDFIIGDLSSASIEEVWNSDLAQTIYHSPDSMIRDSSPCKKCSEFKDCNDRRRRCVVKVIKAYGRENWDYPDPRCKFAPALINELNY